MKSLADRQQAASRAWQFFSRKGRIWRRWIPSEEWHGEPKEPSKRAKRQKAAFVKRMARRNRDLAVCASRYIAKIEHKERRSALRMAR